MIPLSTATLADVEALGVPTPRYDRAALAPRILHLGVGGFHRAHLALYVHELAEAGGDWGIRGLGMLEQIAAWRACWLRRITSTR